MGTLKIKQLENEFYVDGLSEIPITNDEHALNLYVLARRLQSISHPFGRVGRESPDKAITTILLLKMERQNNKGKTATNWVKFVKLCGSEKIRRRYQVCHNGSGSARSLMSQHKSVDNSIQMLHNVICSILRKDNVTPRRDSKLTRILNEELGGNAKTFFMLNCSLLKADKDETIRTLKFGNQIKLIKNYPVAATHK